MTPQFLGPKRSEPRFVEIATTWVIPAGCIFLAFLAINWISQDEAAKARIAMLLVVVAMSSAIISNVLIHWFTEIAQARSFRQSVVISGNHDAAEQVVARALRSVCPGQPLVIAPKAREVCTLMVSPTWWNYGKYLVASIHPATDGCEIRIQVDAGMQVSGDSSDREMIRLTVEAIVVSAAG